MKLIERIKRFFVIPIPEEKLHKIGELERMYSPEYRECMICHRSYRKNSIVAHTTLHRKGYLNEMLS